MHDRVRQAAYNLIDKLARAAAKKEKGSKPGDEVCVIVSVLLLTFCRVCLQTASSEAADRSSRAEVHLRIGMQLLTHLSTTVSSMAETAVLFFLSLCVSNFHLCFLCSVRSPRRLPVMTSHWAVK